MSQTTTSFSTPAPGPSSAPHEVTYEEFMQMPETNQPTEVIDGVIVEMPMPTYVHQEVVMNIGLPMRDFVRSLGLGTVFVNPVDIVIRKRPKLRIRQPDVCFLSSARAGFQVRDDLKRLQSEHIPPDLVVEVLSRGQNEDTLAEKLSDYASIQVDEVWFADQETKSIRVLAREGDHYKLAGEFRAVDRVESSVLPGINLDVASVFA